MLCAAVLLALASDPPAPPPAPPAVAPAPAPAVVETPLGAPAVAPALATPSSGSDRCSEPPKKAVVAHVAVQDVDVPALDERAKGILTAALAAEVRKVDGTSVMGMDEVRALLEQEAQKQLAGCDGESCMSELADALGAELVVSARIAQIGDQVAVSFRRFDNRDAGVKGVDKQVSGAVTGEEFLALLGPAVGELFPDMPLKKGATRGASPETARKLSPPPLPSWMFWSTAAATGAGAATGVLAGGYSQSVLSQLQTDIDNSGKTGGIDGRSVKDRLATSQTSALVANVSFAAAAGLALATGAMFMFTDFDGYADALE